MAPGLAQDSLTELAPDSLVLDPMAGSGTVLRQAAALGLRGIGFDLDPLAVLMSRVWTSPVGDDDIERLYARLIAIARGTEATQISLPWQQDEETSSFVAYWFAEPQLGDLKKLAFGLEVLRNTSSSSEEAALHVLELNLSRIIVTKEQAASLARDTSHSRPHKVVDSSEFDVFDGYEKSLGTLRRRLAEGPLVGGARIETGDARSLESIGARTVDCVVTSPPYLNAIDYLRGHRMALVWLGWSMAQLRRIRSESIGAERAPSLLSASGDCHAIIEAMVHSSTLPNRYNRMIHRYAVDLKQMLSEVARVLKVGAHAT